MDRETQLRKSTEPATRRLDSWKEIASHLGRNVRTVQLWEKNEGLPVHRHPHAARSSVFAFSAELDAWYETRRASSKLDTPPIPAPASTSLQAPETLNSISKPAKRWNGAPVWKVVALCGACILLVLPLLAVVLRDHAANRSATRQLHPRSSQTVAKEDLVLAVLPFEDLSAKPADAYLGEGFTDDLTSLLGQSAKLRVIAPHSANRFRDSQTPHRQIAEELHANLLIEGSVTCSRTRMRITVHLADPANDRELWSQSYERSFSPSRGVADNILGAQDDIAYEAATALMRQLSSREPSVRRPVNVTDSRTRLNYLMGRYYWARRDVPSLQQSIGYFKQSIVEDPTFAPAYSGLADCYSVSTVWGLMPSQQAFTLARAAAVKALELDSDSAEAHTSLAFINFQQDWNFIAAEEQFRTALKLDPSYARAHQWYGEMLQDLGREDQAIVEFQKAVALDPLAPIISSELAMAFAYAGRTDQAISALKQLLSRNPDFAPSHLDLSTVYEMTGDWQDADDERAAYTRLTGDSAALDSLRIGRNWAQGSHEKALQALHLLEARHADNRLTSFQMAQAYMRVGDHEKALRNLEEAYNKHVRLMITVMLGPTFAPLHQDPRFQDLVRQIGVHS